MTKPELGIYDVIDRHQMADFPLAADVYDEHIRGAVGGGFGFVDHHVVSFDPPVGYIVG